MNDKRHVAVTSSESSDARARGSPSALLGGRRRWRALLPVVELCGFLLFAVLAVAWDASGLALPLLPAGTFQIVPGESSVTFSVPDNRGGFTGRTSQVTGRVTVETRPGSGAYTARISASIDTRSITTGVGSRDAAMRTMFLHTAEFPAITYQATATATPGTGVRPFPVAVRGRLTIQNITREQDFTSTGRARVREYVADASTTLRMADYKIPYPRAFIFVARDPVTIRLHIVARSAEATLGVRDNRGSDFYWVDTIWTRWVAKTFRPALKPSLPRSSRRYWLPFIGTTEDSNLGITAL